MIFQSQILWGLISISRSGGCPIWALNPSLLGEDLHACAIPSACGSLLGAFQTAVFPLGQGVRLPAASERGISISYSILWPLGTSPVGFPSQMFWGFNFPLQIPGVRVLHVGHHSLLWERSLVRSLPLCVTSGDASLFLCLVLPFSS